MASACKDFRGENIYEGDHVFLAGRSGSSAEMKYRVVVKIAGRTQFGISRYRLTVRCPKTGRVGHGVEAAKCAVDMTKRVGVLVKS